MATIDRFKLAVKSSKLSVENGTVNLTAQMKYDYLAAIHTMEQIEELATAIKSRTTKREALKEKIFSSCRNTLKSLVDDENGIKEIKNIEHAIKVLSDCRTELLKMEGQGHEDLKLAHYIRDGVSAGH